ncbi:MAG: hypothetical protein GF411_18520 [Candidatus Lokiarchaeota archaeon]|nr:hypothetical protein [Candidatus Lokiarchaeota archaeon]
MLEIRHQDKEKDIELAFKAWLVHREAVASLDEILNWQYYKRKWFFDFLLRFIHG